MTPIEICNLALGLIGQGSISSFEDESVPAELCATLYPAAVQTVLEERPWMFATSRLDLGAKTETGDPAWPASFVLPSMVLRVLGADDGSGAWEIEWRREGGTVLSGGAEALYVRAIMLVEDSSRFSPGFTRALGLRLAADLAGPITENASLVDRLGAQYRQLVILAGSIDGTQGSADRRKGWISRFRY